MVPLPNIRYLFSKPLNDWMKIHGGCCEADKCYHGGCCEAVVMSSSVTEGVVKQTSVL